MATMTPTMNLPGWRLTLALAATVAPPALAAQAAGPPIVEFTVPRAGNFPHDPAVGADGVVWFTDQANSYIGRLDPVTRVITDFPTPTPGSGPHGITVAPDGAVWYTAQATGLLGRLDPKSGAIEEFPLPDNARNPHTPLAHGGMVWFTDANNNTYGRFDPGTGKADVWAVATPNSVPYGLAAAPDGSLWIAHLGANQLGRVDPRTGTADPVSAPQSRGAAQTARRGSGRYRLVYRLCERIPGRARPRHRCGAGMAQPGGRQRRTLRYRGRYRRADLVR